MTQPVKIKTNIKFYRGLGNIEDRIYGVVTKVNGSWRGCRKDDGVKMKIVFVDAAIAKDIIPNILYCCSLTPMREGDGFVAKSAKIVKFPAVIRTICRKDAHMVQVKFGNKLYIYDPSKQETKKRSIEAIANALRNHVDLANACWVAEEFTNAACMLRHMYHQRNDESR